VCTGSFEEAPEMERHPPRPETVQALRDAGDVTGLLRAYGATRRRDLRAAICAAVASLGDDGRARLLDLLGEESWQSSAGGMLVELDEDVFAEVRSQLDSPEETRRRGALHAVYLYARYRDLPAAHELLGRVAAGDAHAGLGEPAGRMREKVARLAAVRNAEIDRQLERITASLDREQRDGESTVSRMFSAVHRGRMEARITITAMRFAAVRHLIAVVPDYGEAAVGTLLALGIDELHGGVVPMIAGSLRDGDVRRRTFLLMTLVCMRRANVPGARQALEADGAAISEGLERQAAAIYRRWVRER
jgi:hypothetical protein